MANSTIGHIEPFDHRKENWDSYAERFNHYLLVNDIEDEKKIVSVPDNYWQQNIRVMKEISHAWQTCGFEIPRIS